MSQRVLTHMHFPDRRYLCSLQANTATCPRRFKRHLEHLNRLICPDGQSSHWNLLKFKCCRAILGRTSNHTPNSSAAVLPIAGITMQMTLPGPTFQEKYLATWQNPSLYSREFQVPNQPFWHLLQIQERYILSAPGCVPCVVLGFPEHRS